MGWNTLIYRIYKCPQLHTTMTKGKPLHLRHFLWFQLMWHLVLLSLHSLPLLLQDCLCIPQCTSLSPPWIVDGCSWVWRLEVSAWCPPQSLCSTFWGRVSRWSWSSQSKLTCLVSETQRVNGLYSLQVGVIGTRCQAWPLIWVLEAEHGFSCLHKSFAEWAISPGLPWDFHFQWT